MAKKSLYTIEIIPADKHTQWCWRIRHRNGNIVAIGGETYKHKATMLRSLRNVLRWTAQAEI